MIATETQTETRTCRNAGCKVEFTPRCINHWFCSTKCRQTARGKDWGWVRAAALERDNHVCTECSAQDCRLEVHHMVPVSLGGLSTLANCQTLCVSCHHEKHRSWRAYTMDKAEADKRIADTIAELADACDLVLFKSYIGKKTRYGKKPHAQPWGYTEGFLSQYAPATSVEQVSQPFERVGVPNEVRACIFLTVHDDLVP